jgi:two-component system, LytTR family, response regulator LytT
MKILVVEDEAPAARRLVKLIQEAVSEANIVQVLDSVESTVNWLRANPSPDLLLLDIHLADGNSFLIFEQTEVKCPVIFATAFDEYAIKAFKVNSIDYLLKPIEKAELQKALLKFKHLKGTATIDMQQLLAMLKEEKSEYKERFLARVADRLVPIEVAHIHYFVAEDKLIYLQTPTHKYPIDFTLDELENLLNPKHFFRLNRKVLGHLQSIQKIHNHLNGKLKITLTPNYAEELFVSREKASEFKAWLEK